MQVELLQFQLLTQKSQEPFPVASPSWAEQSPGRLATGAVLVQVGKLCTCVFTYSAYELLFVLVLAGHLRSNSTAF